MLGDFSEDIEDWGAAWRGILFRREYKELEELIRRSLEIFGKIPGAEYKGGDQRTWYIPSASRRFPGYATLKMRNLKSMEDVGEYNGHQYTWIGFDELTEHPSPDPYIFMLGCCRSSVGAPCRVRSTGNPGRPGHGWVKARFIDVAHPFELYIDPKTGLSRVFIPSRLEDNKILMDNDPNYERRLLSFQPHLVKALRWGDWDSVVGQVFSEFNRDRHCIRRTPLDWSWYRCASLDWGFARPFSIGWWAINDDGRAIRYKEWYGYSGNPNEGLRMGAKEVAKKAWEMSIDDGVTTMVADPACWSKSDDSDSIAESFEQAGFTMIPANNDRKNGLQKLHDMLLANGHDGRPMLMIMDNCTNWMRTVPTLTADPRDPEDIDTELEDHAYDDTRYFLMSEFLKNPRALRRGRVYRASSRQSVENYDPLTFGLR